MKRGETTEQITLFNWTENNKHILPCLSLMYHIPNEGKRTNGAVLKAMGLKSGVPDVCLPVPSHNFNGLYLEMKYGKNKPTKDQEAFMAALRQQGYKTAVCYGADEAKAEIMDYLQDPDKMLFHVRAKYGCSVFVDGDRIETLDTKTDRTISALVYPSWHPSGKFVAFSINNTTQDTHPVHRTEVYDKASDVVVYDVEKQEIVTTQALFSKKHFETFPTFSPDGKQLYFCSAPALKVPGELRDLRYSLCRVSFDPESRTFGSVVDTIFQAETEGQSILFPRVSPDGKYLLCTTTSYGTFPIWHKDADLCMFDLSTGAQVPTEEANSPDTDSYHSWSSNSKWVVFSSRRLDGLYTRPFIAHVGERGVLSKPFVLPQKSTEYYTFLTKSYNIPEFVKGKVKTDTYKLVSRIKEGKNQQISFTK